MPIVSDLPPVTPDEVLAEFQKPQESIVSTDTGVEAASLDGASMSFVLPEAETARIILGDEPAGTAEAEQDPVQEKPKTVEPLSAEEKAAIDQGIARGMEIATAGRAEVRALKKDGMTGKPDSIRSQGADQIAAILSHRDADGNARFLEHGTEAVVRELSSGKYFPDQVGNVIEGLRRAGIDEPSVRKIGAEAMTRIAERMLPTELTAGAPEFLPGSEDRRKLNRTINKIASSVFGRGDNASPQAIMRDVEARGMKLYSELTDTDQQKRMRDAIDRFADNHQTRRGDGHQEIVSAYRAIVLGRGSMDAGQVEAMVTARTAEAQKVVDAATASPGKMSVKVQSHYQAVEAPVEEKVVDKPEEKPGEKKDEKPEEESKAGTEPGKE